MSDNEHTTVRIVDIARMAGVSVATVDRVIHNRGKVSEENLARINEVLRRVDYRPNLIARSLASGRRYTLCAVMPRFAPGEYWADFEAGIARAEAEAVRYNVTVRRFCFDQYDRSSFESLLETLRREEFDGAVIATLFAEMVEPFTREPDAREAPFRRFGHSRLQPAGLFRHVVVRRRGGSLHGCCSTASIRERTSSWADRSPGDAGLNQWRNGRGGIPQLPRSACLPGPAAPRRAAADDEAQQRPLDEMFREIRRLPGPDLQFDVLHPCGLSGAAGAMAMARLRRDLPQRGGDASRGRGDGARRPASRGAGLPRGDGPKGMARRGRAPSKINNMPIDILSKENIPYYKNNII